MDIYVYENEVICGKYKQHTLQGYFVSHILPEHIIRVRMKKVWEPHGDITRVPASNLIRGIFLLLFLKEFVYDAIASCSPVVY